MLRLISKLSFLPALVLSFCAVSCIDVQYIGTSYPATDDAKVYFEKSKIPHQYTVMGRALADADYNEYTPEEMLEKLRSKAESEGADAVLITGCEVLPTEQVREDQLLNTAPNNVWAVDDSSKDGWRYMQQDFDLDYGGRSSIDVRTYRRIYKALFLKYKGSGVAPSAKSEKTGK